MSKLTRVNEQHWCGWPILPGTADSQVSCRRPEGWVAQHLIRGQDVVITRGNVHNYGGTVNLKLNRRLKDYCKDFAGCYVLARVSLSGVKPRVQIHDVISEAPMEARMKWLNWILSAKRIRESGYEVAPVLDLATKRPISLRIMLMKDTGDILLKTKQSPCKARPESPVQSGEWIKLSKEREVYTFFDKMDTRG